MSTQGRVTADWAGIVSSGFSFMQCRVPGEGERRVVRGLERRVVTTLLFKFQVPASNIPEKRES